MLAMMASPRFSDFKDYEVMFKQHVHDNLLLNSDLRLLDEMKKSKLRELKRDKDVFKNRYQYSKNKSVRALPDMYYTRQATPRATSKPSFVVCKTSPCSLKTWNNMTDLTKERVDVYRTDVLQTPEAEVSFRKKLANNSKSEEIVPDISTMPPQRRRRSLALLRSHSSITKSPREVVSVKNTDEKADDFHLPDFRQRSCTMPSYCYNSKGTNNVGKKDTAVVSKFACDRKSQHETILNENSPEHHPVDEEKIQSCLSQSNAIVNGHGPENGAHSSDSTENVPKVSFDLSNQDQRGGFTLQRTKSFGNNGDTRSPNMFRRRSCTSDSSKIKPKDVRKLLVKRESVSLNKLDMAVRRLSLIEKLVTTNMSLAADDSAEEQSSSLEDVQSCRYLRVPGQDINGSQDLSLENLTFTQDN